MSRKLRAVLSEPASQLTLSSVRPQKRLFSTLGSLQRYHTSSRRTVNPQTYCHMSGRRSTREGHVRFTPYRFSDFGTGTNALPVSPQSGVQYDGNEAHVGDGFPFVA